MAPHGALDQKGIFNAGTANVSRAAGEYYRMALIT